jgi:acetoin utilization protein AcuB
MSSSVVSTQPQVRLFAALKLMSDRHVRRLPVIEGRKLVGIITKSDIYAALGPVAQWGTFEEGGEPTVEEYMTPKPLAVSSKDPLEAAALLMHDNRFSGLPVVDANRLVGIITETDIFKAMIDILGMKEGGARIVIRLSSPKNLLSELSKATSGLAVRSVVTFHDKESWKAVVRVRGREKE